MSSKLVKLATIGLFVLAFSSVCFVAGCGEMSASYDDTATVSESEDNAVLARIERLTSCSELQDEFDVASDNADVQDGSSADRSIEYMEAADARMEELGCY